MRKVVKKALLRLCISSILLFPLTGHANLIWSDMEVTTEVKEVPGLKTTSVTPPKSDAVKIIPQNNKSNTSTSTTSTDDFSTLIAEIKRKRAERDNLLDNLLTKAAAKKEQEQQQIIANLIATQKKQKEDDEKKFTAIIDELKKQQAEQLAIQQAKHEKSITDIIAELKRQHEEQLKSNREQQQQILASQAPQQQFLYTPTQNVSETPTFDVNPVFSYSSGSISQIYCKEGYLTDIALQAGEDLQYIGIGDTTNWVIDRAQSGSKGNKVTHIYIKPLKTGIDTNLVITTDKRSYQIVMITENDKYTPMVRWNYPQEEKMTVFRHQKSRS